MFHALICYSGLDEQLYAYDGEVSDEAERPPNRKEKLSIAGQIEDLRRRGVRFDAGEVELARDCLAHRRSLLHLSAYRTLFPKHLEGPHKGKYIDLSFGDLVMLDELDSQLRDTFLYLALQAEMSAKMRLLFAVSECSEEDGYEIVQNFMSSLSPSRRNALIAELARRGGKGAPKNPYTGELIRAYEQAMPIWVFVEVITFGTLLSLYRFCSIRWNSRKMNHEYYLLKQVKDVRNACGHQNCIVNGFSKVQTNKYRVVPEIKSALAKHNLSRSDGSRDKLCNPCIQGLVSVLYSARYFSPSTEFTIKRLSELDTKLVDTINAFGPPVRISFVSYLLYLHKVIQAWFLLTRDP